MRPIERGAKKLNDIWMSHIVHRLRLLPELLERLVAEMPLMPLDGDDESPPLGPHHLPYLTVTPAPQVRLRFAVAATVRGYVCQVCLHVHVRHRPGGTC